MKDKLQPRERLKAIVSSEKQAGNTVVFTNGCFDLLHVGHIRYLQEAKRCGDILVVGINSDESVRKLKGEERPLIPEQERTEIVAALASVDYVTIFDEETPASLIAELVPHVLVKGGDYVPDTVVGRDTVEKAGGRVKIIPLFEGKSTAAIIETIVKRYSPHSNL